MINFFRDMFDMNNIPVFWRKCYLSRASNITHAVMYDDNFSIINKKRINMIYIINQLPANIKHDFVNITNCYLMYNQRFSWLLYDSFIPKQGSFSLHLFN